jgi:5-formyltetrahydrofolate cyclo-ligase
MVRDMPKEPVGKDEIRRFIRAKRREMDPVWVEQKSLVIERQVTELPEFAKAGIVCCYLAMEQEVKTDRILERCWKEGKTVCVPAYSRSAGKYRLSKLGKGIPVIEGPWKIWEPARTEWIAAGKVDFIIVPGLAFDTCGGRLGHGGGHYDRILGAGKTSLRCFKAGLAFDFQILQRVPMGKNDVRMDVIVTEKRVVKSDGIAS